MHNISSHPCPSESGAEFYFILLIYLLNFKKIFNLWNTDLIKGMILKVLCG